MGVRTLSSEALPLASVRHLREGGFLGVLADQRVRRGGYRVSFLGQDTQLAEGPVRLAGAAGSPLVPLGIHRRPDHRHRIRVLPPIEPEGDPRERTQDLADALGRLIAEAPAQWVWIHPRWEDPPEAGRLREEGSAPEGEGRAWAAP
jgi:KDO2-lipid IV(A) lauroyltransferase